MANRLAAARAQQGGRYQPDSYGESGGGSDNYGAAGGGGGYQSRRPNPYAQQDDNPNRYEMTTVNTSNANSDTVAAGGGGDMNAFWNEVTDVQNLTRSYNDNVNRIAELHARSLNNIGDQGVQQQIEDTVAETRQMAKQLKIRIKALQAQGGDSRDGQTRRQQAGLLKTRFQEAIQNYQQVEQRQRAASKQRVERQYRIVNPSATSEQVSAVVNNESGGPIFQQALMNSQQGESRAAYREVQERHQDLQRIEQTIAELAQLFNDMAILVEEQGEQVKAIEATTQNVQVDTEAGLVYTEKAKESAMSARKKRWICFIITLVIVIIIAIVIGIQVAQGNIGNLGKKNDTPPAVVTTVTATASSVASSTALRGG